VRPFYPLGGAVPVAFVAAPERPGVLAGGGDDRVVDGIVDVSPVMRAEGFPPSGGGRLSREGRSRDESRDESRDGKRRGNSPAPYGTCVTPLWSYRCSVRLLRFAQRHDICMITR
jgi:hypothetical protein